MKKYNHPHTEMIVTALLLCFMFLSVFPIDFMIRQIPGPISDALSPLLLFGFGVFYFPIAAIYYGITAYKKTKTVLLSTLIWLVIVLLFMVGEFIFIVDVIGLDTGNMNDPVSMGYAIMLTLSHISAAISVIISLIVSFIAKINAMKDNNTSTDDEETENEPTDQQE